MTADKKLKHNPIGQIRYYWNLALFARRFEVEVDAPPEVVAEHIQTIAQAQLGNYPSTIVVDSANDGSNYDFSIDVKRIFGDETRQATTTVKATGRILYSEGYKTTIVRGDIRLSGIFYAALVIYAIIVVALVILLNMTLVAGAMLGVLILVGMLFIAIQVRTDYLLLISQMESVRDKANRSGHYHSGASLAQLHLPQDDDRKTFKSDASD